MNSSELQTLVYSYKHWVVATTLVYSYKHWVIRTHAVELHQRQADAQTFGWLPQPGVWAENCGSGAQSNTSSASSCSSSCTFSSGGQGLGVSSGAGPLFALEPVALFPAPPSAAANMPCVRFETVSEPCVLGEAGIGEPANQPVHYSQRCMGNGKNQGVCYLDYLTLLQLLPCLGDRWYCRLMPPAQPLLSFASF